MTQKVWFSKKAPFSRKVAKRQCVREGLQFEAMAQIWLGKAFKAEVDAGGKFFHSKWISFLSEGRECHAQPDSFLLMGEIVIIFEMKLRHTARSAPQLIRYRDLLRSLYPDRVIYLCELYKYWDWLRYPAEFIRLENPPYEVGKAWSDGVIGLYSPDL